VAIPAHQTSPSRGPRAARGRRRRAGAAAGRGSAGVRADTRDETAESQADAEYRRTVAAAAGRGTLADPLQRRTDPVLAKSAGEARVSAVLAQSLEGLFVLGREADGNVAQARDLHPVRQQRRLHIGEQRRFDLGRAPGDAEHGPLLGGQLAHDARAQRLQYLLARPVGDKIVGRLPRTDQREDQRRGIIDLERILAEHAQPHREARLGILDVVDGTTERQAHELARADEIKLGAIHVVAARPIDDVAEERQQRPVECRAPLRQGADHLALFDEERGLVGLDRDLGEFADGEVRPLIQDRALRLVRTRDELPVQIITFSE
jgi:hypothetical protein